MREYEGVTMFSPTLSGRWACAAIAALCINSAAFAQDDSRHETLKAARDGFPIHITYYPSKDEFCPDGRQNAPVVVMLHGKNSSRIAFDKGSAPRQGDPFPVALQKLGFAAITVDLRKHGESTLAGGASTERILPNDYQAMVVGDLVGVKKFIFDEHQAQNLNMNKTGIIACDDSVPIAVAFTELDWKQRPYDDSPVRSMRTPRGQDVRALVLVSPVKSSGRVHASRSLQFLKDPRYEIAFQILVGESDPDDKGDAADMHKILGSGPRQEEEGLVQFVKVPLRDRGVSLFGRAPQLVEVPVLRFLDTHLKKLDSTWQDRRSRLER